MKISYDYLHKKGMHVKPRSQVNIIYPCSSKAIDHRVTILHFIFKKLHYSHCNFSIVNIILFYPCFSWTLTTPCWYRGIPREVTPSFVQSWEESLIHRKRSLMRYFIYFTRLICSQSNISLDNWMAVWPFLD